MTFKALSGFAPLYVSELLSPLSTSVSSRTLRSSAQDLLAVPRTWLKTKGRQAFATLAPTLWNRLPLDIKRTDSVDTFRKLVKTFLFRKHFVMLPFTTSPLSTCYTVQHFLSPFITCFILCLPMNCYVFILAVTCCYICFITPFYRLTFSRCSFISLSDCF